MHNMTLVQDCQSLHAYPSMLQKQVVEATLPGAEDMPMGQRRQLAAPPGEYVLGGHCWQVPSKPNPKPGRHSLQSVAKAAAYPAAVVVPGGQVWHATAPLVTVPKEPCSSKENHNMLVLPNNTLQLHSKVCISECLIHIVTYM
jgi:hypothetical protein